LENYAARTTSHSFSRTMTPFTRKIGASRNVYISMAVSGSQTGAIMQAAVHIQICSETLVNIRPPSQLGNDGSYEFITQTSSSFQTKQIVF
jgi:hypothetical protein